jgi:hypothetical protein
LEQNRQTQFRSNQLDEAGSSSINRQYQELDTPPEDTRPKRRMPWER